MYKKQSDYKIPSSVFSILFGEVVELSFKKVDDNKLYYSNDSGSCIIGTIKNNGEISFNPDYFLNESEALTKIENNLLNIVEKNKTILAENVKRLEDITSRKIFIQQVERNENL